MNTFYVLPLAVVFAETLLKSHFCLSGEIIYLEYYILEKL